MRVDTRKLPTGAWQSFDKAFTDAEMELIPKAIDAKMISVKTVDGKVRYSRTGDLGTWLADNPAIGPIKFSMENGRVQVVMAHQTTDIQAIHPWLH